MESKHTSDDVCVRLYSRPLGLEEYEWSSRPTRGVVVVVPRSLSRGLGFGVYTHEEGFLCTTRESHIFWGKKERKKSTLNPSLSLSR